MNGKRKQILMATAVLLAGALILYGCSKKVETTEPVTTEAVAATATEQKTCPVMGGAVNKNMFVEYKGKKVYFCCAGCEGKFNADPAKYIAKLPQFQN